MSLMDEIKARIADIKCDYDKMNPYQLYFDCQALISEVEYWKDSYQSLADYVDREEADERSRAGI
jgi:hypothetical protein